MRSWILTIFNILIAQALFAQIEFHPLEGPSGGNVVKTVANSSGELFAVGGGKIYKSLDVATTWNELDTYTHAAPVDIYIDDTDKIYILNGFGVANSVDGGTSWTQVDAVSGFQAPQKLMKNHLTGALFMKAYTGTLYGLMRSTDEGANWTGSYTADQVNDFTIKNTATFNHIYIATNGADKIQKNTNNGNPISWAAVNTGTPSATPVSIEVNKFSGAIYAIFYGPGVYIATNDVTTTWSLVAGVPATIDYGNSNGSWDVYTSTSSDRWFVAYNENVGVTGSINRLFTSATINPIAASGWTELTALSAQDPINSVHSFSSTILVSSSTEGILKSTNTGTSWGVGDYGISLTDSRGFILGASNYELLSAHGTNRVAYSFDNNFIPTFITESKPVTAGIMTSFVKLSTNTILAVGSQTYSAPSNDLSNFTLKGNSPSTVTLSKAYRHADNVIYGIGSMVGSTNNIYRTTNEGTTWSIYAITGVPTNREYTHVSTTTNGDLYVGLIDNGITPRIYRVPIAGLAATLLTIPNFTEYDAVYAIGTKIYAFGLTNTGRKIAFSTDAGSTWTQKPSTPTENFFVARDGVLFGQQNNVVYFSNDDGDTWQGIITLGSQQEIIGVALDNSLRAIVGVSEGPFQMSSGPVVPPNVPQNFKSIATGSSAVYLQWDYNSLPAVDEFVIEKRLAAAPTFVEIGNAGSGNRYFRDFTISPSTDYVYRIKATNTAGVAYSAELSVSTPADCAPTIPDNRSWTGTIAGATTNTAINIKKLSDDLYLISDLTSNSISAAPHSVPGPVSGTFFQNCAQPFINKSNILYPNLTGTTNGTNQIVLNWQTDVAVGTVVTKTITLTLNSAALEPAPDVPTNVKAYASSSTQATVSWNSGYYQHQYIVERATNSGFTTGLTQIGGAPVDYPATSVLDNGPLTPGTTYFYRVRAENIDNDVSANSTTSSLNFADPNFILSNTLVSTTEVNAVAALWSDFDNDGDEDLVLHDYGLVVSDEIAPLFFRNNGTGDFTIQSGGGNEGAYVASVAGDYDNDGSTDLFFGGFGSFFNASVPKKAALLKNNGAFSFSSVAGLPFAVSPAIPATASWVDVNKDGKLDLYMGYLSSPKLYLGNGAGGFTEKAADALVTDAYEPTVAIWNDYDNDKDQDVFIINDNGPNRLYQNDGSGNFTYVTGSVFDADNTQSFISAAFGDYDNDGDEDLYAAISSSVSTPGSNILYQNNGNGTFSKLPDVANSPTESKTVETSACGWADIDNDGDLDLVVANAIDDNGTTSGYGTIYLNSGTGTFTKAGSEYLTAGSKLILPVATSFADYDNDGFQDLVIGEFSFAENGSATKPKIKLLKNNHATGNYLKFKLVGTTSNANGIGARVKITANSKTQYRQVRSLTGRGSQNSMIVHFGIGAATSVSDVTVEWPSGVVQNFGSRAINQTHTLTEDGAGPVALSFAPVNAATQVAANTQLSITLNENSTPVAGKQLIVYLNSTFASVDGVLVTDAVKSGNTYTFTLPNKLLPGTQYNIGIDDGAFIDDFGNASLEFGSGSWTFTVGPAPTATFTPAHNATAVALNAPLQISFNKIVSAVAGKKIRVLDGATIIVDLDVSTNGDLVSSGTSVYTLTPATNWPASKLLTVTVDAGAFVDASLQTDFAGIATNSWNFTTDAAADITAPVVSLVPEQAPLVGFGNTTRQINATDDVAVTSVVVSIRKISETTFLNVPANQGVVDQTKWNFDFLEANHFDGMGTELYITVKDAANNETRIPATGTLKIYLRYEGAQAATINSQFVGSGGAKTGWKIFSIPFELGSNNSIPAIFDEAITEGKKEKVDFAFLTIQGADATDWTQYPDFSTISRGQGYFSNIKSPVAITIPDATAPTNSRDNLFAMNLNKGWNMVGNPYLTQISWANVVALGGLTSNAPEIVKYNGSGYTNSVQTLQPWEGALVFANNAATNVKIPFFGQTAEGGRTKGYQDLGNDIDADEWMVKLNLQNGEHRYDLGGIGMAPDADASYDKYDGVTPPRMFDYLEMNFGHAEHFAKRFTRDIVPTQTTRTWDFSVDSNLEGEATLTWDNSALSSATRDIFLLDVSRQTLVNMKETGSYSFNPKESVTFKVYFGENLSIAPERVQLGKAYPNPTSGTTMIAFSLPEAGGTDQRVTLDIVDAMGRTAGTISHGRFNPGYHELAFDAKGLNSGMYAYRLTVQGKQGKTSVVNKLIIK